MTEPQTASASSLESIERLPPENLAEIFMFCLPSGRWASYWPNTENAPWVLAQVCSRWRAVALSTPRLWRTIEVHLAAFPAEEIDINDGSSSAGDSSDEIDINDCVSTGSPSLHSLGSCGSSSARAPSPHTMMHLISLFLERSGSSPFTLIVSWEHDKPHELTPMLSRVVLMLTRESHRWEQVSYRLPLSLLVTLPSVRGRLQSLRTLDLRLGFTGDEGAVIDHFEDAPLLQSVDLFMWPSPTGIPVAVKFPSAQLTSYTCLFQRLSDVFTTLHEMPSLMLCDLYYKPLPDNDDDPTDIPPLRLAHLRNISLDHSSNDSDGSYLAHLTDRLTLPRLEHLEVNCANELFPHLTALVARSRCRLRTFSVRGMQFNSAVFDFFVCVPTITELTLGSIILTVNEAAWPTRPTPPISCPLPALRVLNMDYTRLPATEFVQMIESRVDDARRAGGACLEELRVTNIVLDRNTLTQLLSLRRPGLRVTVVDQYDRDLAPCEDKEDEEEVEEPVCTVPVVFQTD